MDNLSLELIRAALTFIVALLTIKLVDSRKARAEVNKSEADVHRAGNEELKSLSESAATLADTGADLGKSWQEYALRASQEFAEYKKYAEQRMDDLRKELEEYKRKSSDDTARQNAIIFDLTAQIATLKRENSDLRQRVVELETENGELKKQYPRRTLGAK